jgi:TonB family protein
MTAILSGITIVFGVAWFLTALLPRASAALRHLVWTCSFAAVLLLAPLRWWVPHREIAAPLPAIAATTGAAAARTAINEKAEAEYDASHEAATGGVARTAAMPESRFDPSAILPALWALGTLLFTARLLRNAIRLRTIVGNAQGHAPVLTSSHVPGPLAAGLFRPVILLPGNAGSWTLARRRAVLAHEAAHIRRRDPAILLTAHITTAIYWFHPLCWLALARLRAESEHACDDAALRTGLLPSGYATDLLDLARMFETQIAIPMATTSHLESRVKSILDPLTNRSFPVRRTWLAAIALTAALLAPLATFTLRAQQAGTTTITGTVSDPTGAVVPNATVVAIDQSGTRETTVSGSVGSYSFSNIPPGVYTLEVRAPGFAVFRQDNLALATGGKLEANARLAVGSLNERITVNAQGTPKPRGVGMNVTAGPIRVGGNVQAPTVIRQLSPTYPGFLQAQGIEGTVLLSALISKQGIPTVLKVLKNPGNEELVTAALEAVEQWRYQPTRLNGEPIEVLTTIQVDFKLSPTVPVIDDRIQR